MESQTNRTEPSQAIFNREGTITYILICSLIVVLGISMNLLIIYMYVMKKLVRSDFNLCLTHLAAANIMQHIGFLPYLVIDLKQISFKNPVLETFVCGIVDGISFFFAFSFTEGYIICYMSYSRYKVIKYPLKSFSTEKRMKLCTFFAWIGGLVWLTPNTISWYHDRTYGYCLRKQSVFDKIYLPFLWTFILIAPFVYVGIILVLTTIELHGKHVKTTDKTKIRHKNRISRLFAFIYLSHAVCWFPFGIYFILSLIQFYGKGVNAEYKKIRIVRFVIIPCLLESLMNFMVYGFNSQDFRTAFKKFFYRQQHHKTLQMRISNKTCTT